MSPYPTERLLSGIVDQSAKLPQSPEHQALSEESLGTLCTDLSAALYRAHNALVAGLRSSQCPNAIAHELSFEGGVLSLSPQEREGILHLAQGALRASGSALVGGLIDFIGYAHQFNALASPADREGADASLPLRVDGARALINSIGERLIISLSTATTSTEKQLSLSALFGIISACLPILPKQGNELRDAMNTALDMGAEAPVWSHSR